MLLKRLSHFMVKKYYSHQTSTIDNNCKIGAGTKIWHYSHLMTNCVIGKNCIIGQNVFISSKVKIGNNVKIQNNVSLYDGVFCENDVFIGPSVVFTNVINPRSFIERKKEFKKTLIRKGTSIGANSTIICGIELGKYSFIGAGAVVTKSVKDYSLVLGNPALHVGWMSQAGIRLKFNKNNIAFCKKSETKYKLVKDKIQKIK